MIIMMNTIEKENDGHSFFCKIIMVAAEVNSFGIIRVIKFIIKLKLCVGIIY